VPIYPGIRWRPRTSFLAPGSQINCATEVLTGWLTFLNRRVEVSWPPRWHQQELPRLWQYNLHYLDFVWALDYEPAKVLVRDWSSHHPIGKGRVGWEAYPSCLRLLNLCQVFFDRFRDQTENDPKFRDELWASIYLQGEWLSRNLEYHLLGNHLLENGVALYFIGLCFKGDAGERWLSAGRSLVEQELREQVLADAAHFERSPMYQARVVYALTALLNAGAGEIVNILPAISHALGDMSHPDGDIALLNDSAMKISNTFDEIAVYSKSVLGYYSSANGLLDTEKGTRCWALPEAGYYGARCESGDYLVCDAGPIGPDYLPGHAHGDIFSFELSLLGKRVIVDSGVHDYERSEMRRYCRSTQAHNTVEIDGQDQCEFWAAFRVARRGRPKDVEWVKSEQGFRLSGWHDGYLRLRSRARHARQFTWHHSGVLMVKDRVAAKLDCDAVSRIHLHPDCELRLLDERRVRVWFPGGDATICFAGLGQLGFEEYPYCPEFGVSMKAAAIKYSVRGSSVETAFCLARGAEGIDLSLREGALVNGCQYAW
jgi:uncharacterized heparinase superfamily protein